MLSSAEESLPSKSGLACELKKQKASSGLPEMSACSLLPMHLDCVGDVEACSVVVA